MLLAHIFRELKRRLLFSLVIWWLFARQAPPSSPASRSRPSAQQPLLFAPTMRARRQRHIPFGPRGRPERAGPRHHRQHGRPPQDKGTTNDNAGRRPGAVHNRVPAAGPSPRCQPPALRCSLRFVRFMHVKCYLRARPHFRGPKAQLAAEASTRGPPRRPWQRQALYLCQRRPSRSYPPLTPVARGCARSRGGACLFAWAGAGIVNTVSAYTRRSRGIFAAGSGDRWAEAAPLVGQS